jgi:hypothetical protein
MKWKNTFNPTLMMVFLCLFGVMVLGLVTPMHAVSMTSTMNDLTMLTDNPAALETAYSMMNDNELKLSNATCEGCHSDGQLAANSNLKSQHLGDNTSYSMNDGKYNVENAALANPKAEYQVLGNNDNDVSGKAVSMGMVGSKTVQRILTMSAADDYNPACLTSSGSNPFTFGTVILS